MAAATYNDPRTRPVTLRDTRGWIHPWRVLSWTILPSAGHGSDDAFIPNAHPPR